MAELKVLKKKYSSQAVELLTELLRDAKQGKITDLVCSYASGVNEYSLTYTGTDDLIRLVGHLEKMKWRMLERMNK
mgnify:FL=1